MSFLNQLQISAIIDIAIKAGDIAISSFNDRKFEIIRKSDGSPVTSIDKKISLFIEKNLQQYFPEIEIVCEEGSNRIVSKAEGLFWLIDPIDGTTSFIDHDPEFTVNIALIKNRRPVFGVIYAPAIEDAPLYYTDKNNQIVKLSVKKNQQQIIKNSPQQKNHFTVITSKRTPNKEVEEYIKNNFPKTNLQNLQILKVSSSLKFCYMIENKADLYLHFRKSIEWDIAAGHALLLAYGGEVYNLNGGEMTYLKNEFVNPSFLASVRK